jgi:hypothetical protein
MVRVAGGTTQFLMQKSLVMFAQVAVAALRLVFQRPVRDIVNLKYEISDK